MAEHHRRRSSVDSSVLRLNRLTEEELVMYTTAPPEDEYYTPPTTTTTIQSTTGAAASAAAATGRAQAEFSKTEYRSYTLKPFNNSRRTILPVFPPRSTLISMGQQQRRTITTVGSTLENDINTNINEEQQHVDFLLCNVPSKRLSYFFFFVHLK